MVAPAPMNVAADKQEYVKAAQNTFQALKPVFSGGDFWVRGHSFDTVVDYFQNVDASDANDFAGTAIDGYEPIADAWYDDFSWWGIACLKAATASVFSAENQIRFHKIALQAWGGMVVAPYGWAFCDNKDLRGQYEPLFEGGVWNHILALDANPSNPDSPYSGRQNTVTNLGYLVLATRLVLDRGLYGSVLKAARDAMELEGGFLAKWLDYSDAKYKLRKDLPPVLGPAYVVRERVGLFKKGSDPKYDPDWVWTGDQGLMLGSLVDRMRLAGINGPPNYYQLLKQAQELLRGAGYLIRDKILQPWAPSPPDKRYEKDYWNGPAVYMRYLLWAFQHIPDLKKDLEAGFQQFLRNNADEVVKNPNRPQSGVPIVDLTNNLAILVAAIAMLK